MIREHRSYGSLAHDSSEAAPSTTICTWEVLPSDSRFPIVASGITTDADKAKREVEAAMAKPGAGFGHLVRTAIPGLAAGARERKAWPPLGEVQQCRRNRTGGFAWHPLYPAYPDVVAS